MGARASGMTERRFPPPWDIEGNGACLIIRDANGQALSYVYYERITGPPRKLSVGSTALEG
jgi:hypothetical protein